MQSNNMKIILNNCLKDILNNLIINKQLTNKDLNLLIQIIYNEIINNTLFDENNKEISSLILSILSYYNDIMSNECQNNDILIQNNNENKQNFLEKYLEAYSYGYDTKDWDNFTEELNDEVASVLLDKLLVVRNK